MKNPGAFLAGCVLLLMALAGFWLVKIPLDFRAGAHRGRVEVLHANQQYGDSEKIVVRLLPPDAALGEQELWGLNSVPAIGTVLDVWVNPKGQFGVLEPLDSRFLFGGLAVIMIFGVGSALAFWAAWRLPPRRPVPITEVLPTDAGGARHDW